MSLVDSPNSFIGSKISLISKSEIRYQGVLYSLDLQEATISLAKVKSFGTEDRPTERPVPPKDEVYEFIIFRGSDIKGIDVLEPPKQPSVANAGLPNDPAIVEVSHHYHSGGQGTHTASSSSGIAVGGYNSGGAYSHGFGGSGLLGSKPQSTNSELIFNTVDQAGGNTAPLESTGSTHDASRSNASTPSAFNRKSPTNDAGVQVNDDQNRNNRQYNNRQQDGRGSRRSSQENRRGGGQVDRQAGYQPRGRGNYGNNNRGGGGNFRGGRGGGTRGYRTQGIIQAQQPPKMTYEEPFDFEKANEELQTKLSKLKLGKSEDADKKEESETEAGEGNAEQEEQENKEPPIYYTKANFFDNISCESTERSKGNVSRVDWRAERKLNAETFGIPANGGGNRRGGGNFRGRSFTGGFRGYGGRGGYQQQGGYGYNSGYNSGYNAGYNSYNNSRYNGRGGGRGGGQYRSQQQPQQPQQQQQRTCMFCQYTFSCNSFCQ